MPKYSMRFFFDWGSGVCLWANNKDTKERFDDYPINGDLLPITDDLKTELDKLIYWHDEALNWDDPAGDLLWSEEQIRVFTAEAKKVYIRLCEELGRDYEIIYEDQLII